MEKAPPVFPRIDVKKELKEIEEMFAKKAKAEPEKKAPAHEHTQKEVADIIGISQSYISRLEKRIMKWLKAELEKTAV